MSSRPRAIWLVVPVLFAFLLAGGFALAGDLAPDADSSSALTTYLHKHRLPLVGGQVLSNSNGPQQVVLYGFCATDFGKSDAEAKARAFLQLPDIAIVNHIEVHPELAGMKADGSTGAHGNSSSSNSSPGDIGDQNSYANQNADSIRRQQEAIQQYQNQQNRDPYGGAGGGGFGFMFPLGGGGIMIGP